MIVRSLLLLAVMGAAGVARADDGLGATAAPPPQRTSALVVYGNDPCPEGRGDEVIVCARRPESERYRLPKRFRDAPPGVADGSWTNRVMDLDRANAAVLPNSCSPVGANGQTGCYQQFLAQSRAERRADQAEERAATGK